MKKIFATLVVASATSLAWADNPAGCGLGTEVVFPDADEWHEYVLAATTNGSSGNQTFGMTSGTLGCEEANGPLAAQLFIDQNMDQLSLDTARGQGESLDALAQVLGVAKDKVSDFSLLMKDNFDRLFSASGTSQQTHLVVQQLVNEVAKT